MPDSAQLSVLLKDENQLQMGPLGQAIAAFKKIPFQDAAFAAKNAWGIVGERLDGPTAAQLTDALAKQSLLSVTISHDQLAVLPEAIRLQARDAFPWETFAWDKVRVLGAAAIKSSSQRTVEEKQGPTAGQQLASFGIMMATGLPISLGPKKQTIKKTITDTELSFILDVIVDGPSRRLRISADQFNYTFLKEQMLANVMGNFRLLLKELVKRSPKARQSRGTRILLAGQPVTTMGYETLADLEKECRWLLSLPTSQ